MAEDVESLGMAKGKLSVPGRENKDVEKSPERDSLDGT